MRNLMKNAAVAPVQMPISQISVATTGPTSSSFTDGELSSAQLNVTTSGPESSSRSRRGLFFAAAVVIVLAGAVVVTASVRSGKGGAATAPSPTTDRVAAESKAAAEPAPSAQPAPQNVEDMPVEPTAVAVTKEALAAGSAANRGRATAARPSKAAAKAEPPPAASTAAPAPKASTPSSPGKSKVQWTNPGF
jgi:hypothetical protein